MSPEAQRIAIAESMGAIKRYGAGWEVSSAHHIGRYDFEFVISFIPEYNLDDMHEVEGSLTVSQRITYADHLSKIWTGRTDRAIPHWWWIHESTSANRREAYLRTIGKWLEAGEVGR